MGQRDPTFKLSLMDVYVMVTRRFHPIAWDVATYTYRCHACQETGTIFDYLVGHEHLRVSDALGLMAQVAVL